MVFDLAQKKGYHYQTGPYQYGRTTDLSNRVATKEAYLPETLEVTDFYTLWV
ncbi:MAG: hypothetical protein IPO26_14005 [Saprospiraceae bacterium]|nr:hypothetical protein [Saprospiraceae bacterium]